MFSSKVAGGSESIKRRVCQSHFRPKASEETVKRHLSNIFDKTGVSTRLELALFAISHKLVDIDV